MKSTKLSNLLKKDFNIVKNAKYFVIAPIVIFLVGLIMMCFMGFNLGLDFTGGNVMSISFRDEVTTNQYKEKENIVKDVFASHNVKKCTLQKAGDSSTPTITIKYQDINGVDMEELAETIKQDLVTKLDFSNDQVTNSGRIGASASTKLLTNALLSVGLATLVILIYIAFRFELYSGISAIVALLHDVIIVCACTVIFRIQVNSSFIAAIITIVGYSINNTIVIFDRIRENIRKENYSKSTNAQLVDVSVKDTLSRSLLTATTTLVAVVALAFIGVADIREFVIPIIFGLIAGTYSSMFLSPSLWALMYNRSKDRRLMKKNKDNETETELKEENETAEEQISETEDVANS